MCVEVQNQHCCVGISYKSIVWVLNSSIECEMPLSQCGHFVSLLEFLSWQIFVVSSIKQKETKLEFQ